MDTKHSSSSCEIITSNTRYYSQHGEDVFADYLMSEIGNGFFVEIGCIDGRRFSNTLTFEERGWHGLCVEAHPGYIDMLKSNRPHSIICHCAIGENDEDGVIFYGNSRGSLSTLDPSKEEYFRSRYTKWFTGFEKYAVSKRTLTSVLSTERVGEIDVMSIDIEGYELEALTGLDLNTYRPKLFIIEVDGPSEEMAISDYLVPYGYRKIYKLSQNAFYANEEINYRWPVNKRLKAQLIHTEHPLDSNGDEVVPVELLI